MSNILNPNIIDETELEPASYKVRTKKLTIKQQIKKLREELLAEILSRDLTEFTTSELITTYRFISTQEDKILDDDDEDNSKVKPEEMSLKEYKEFMNKNSK